MANVTSRAIYTAVQWTGGASIPNVTVLGGVKYGGISRGVLRTPTGQLTLLVGDWIITDAKGRQQIAPAALYPTLFAPSP